MKSRLTVAALMAAAGAAGAILAAPIASAEPTNCTNTGNVVSGTSNVCTSPGNAQITSSPGSLGQQQWGMWPWYGGGIGIL